MKDYCALENGHLETARSKDGCEIIVEIIAADCGGTEAFTSRLVPGATLSTPCSGTARIVIDSIEERTV